MLDTFVSLVTIAGTVGKVTSASLYPNGFMVIEVEEGGDQCTLTYSTNAQVSGNEHP